MDKKSANEILEKASNDLEQVNEGLERTRPIIDEQIRKQKEYEKKSKEGSEALREYFDKKKPK